MAPQSCHWYAVLTQPRAEPLATYHLRRQGYGVLYLHSPAEIRHARRIRRVMRPYFPRYLFAEVHGDLPIGPIARTTGVAAIVQAGPSEPLEVPPAVIAELSARGDEKGLVASPQPVCRPIWQQGEAVTIAAGPFLGFMAAVLLDNGDKVRVTLQWLGRKLEAMVEPEALAASSPALRSAPE